MESVEPRVLLSAVDHALHAAPLVAGLPGATPAQVSIQTNDHIGAAVVRKSLAAQLTNVSASGVKGAGATVSAVLTSNGAPLSGRIVRFQIRGRAVGQATTDANGVAVLSTAKTRGIQAGFYARGVTAVFAGDANHMRSTARGPLTVSRFATSLGGVSASGVYGGTGVLTATLTSQGGPMAGQVIRFQLNGRDVGQASTDAHGVATLGNVSLAGLNAGSYASAITASFAGGITYQGNFASGTLTVGKAQASIDLGGLSQTYDGTAKLATVSTSPSGPAYTVVYTDANGNPVSAPRNAGAYTVHVTITDPNESGGAIGTLVIAPAQLGVGGITASDKVYDGTTGAVIQSGGASLSGVVSGDNVTLDGSGAAGTFDTKGAGTGKVVTVSGLRLAGTDAGNYVLAPTTTTADITAKLLTVGGVTANDKIYDGTTAASLNVGGATFTGVIPGDDVTLNASQAMGTFNTQDVGTAKTVTVAGLTLSGADAANYALVQPTTTADVTAKVLTVDGITAANKVYDGTTSATLNTGTAALIGVVSGDDVTLTTDSATGTFGSAGVGTGNAVTITGIALSGAGVGNYVLAQTTATADITAKTLTVSGITAGNKVYDGTTGATIDTSGAVLSGVLPGDDVALDLSGATGSFDTKDAGTGKTVTIAGLVLLGADAGNYVIAPATTTADVTAATLTVSGVVAKNKGYDGTIEATLDFSGASLVGIVPGDDVSLDGSRAAGTFDTPDVGTGKTVTISGVALNGADAGNYVVVQPTATADITVGTLTVGGITVGNKEYDGTTDATIDTSGAVLFGVAPGDDVTLDVSGATGSFDTKDAGTGKTVTVSGLVLQGADAWKYALAPVTTTADVSAKTLTVGGITAGSKEYDGTTGVSIDTSGATLAGVVPGDDVTLDVSGATGSFDTKDAGAGKTVTIAGLALSGADAGNYVLTQPTTTADITAKVLTVDGIAAGNKEYDGTTDASIDTSSAVLSGIVPGDDVTLDVSGATGSFGTKDAGTGKTVTIGGLALQGSDAVNYVIAPPTTTADVTVATLTVSGVVASSKSYDGTTDATVDFSGASLAGVVPGDDVSLDSSGAVGTFDTPGVGTGKAVTISGLALSGADAGNYVLVQPTATADVTAKALTVTGITASDKASDGTTDATLDTTGATLVGVLPGEDVALDVTGAVGTFDSPDPGTDKTVTITGLVLTGADAANYTLVDPTTTASIT